MTPNLKQIGLSVGLALSVQTGIASSDVREFFKWQVEGITLTEQQKIKNPIANGGIIQIAALSPDVSRSFDTTNDNATLAIEDNNDQAETTKFIRAVYDGIIGIANRSKDQGSDVNIQGIDSGLRENLLPKMVKYSKMITQYIGDEDGSIKIRKKYLRRIKRQIKRFFNDYDLGVNEVSVDWILANVPGAIVLATADELSIKNIDYTVTVSEMREELGRFVETGDTAGVSQKLQHLLDDFISIRESSLDIKGLDASIRNSNASIRNSNASISDSNASISDSNASISDSNASISDSRENIEGAKKIRAIIDRINKIRGVKVSNVTN